MCEDMNLKVSLLFSVLLILCKLSDEGKTALVQIARAIEDSLDDL